MNQSNKFIFQPEILSDNLVTLTPLSSSDFEELYAVASDPLVWEGHPARNRHEPAVFAELFDHAIQSGGAFRVTDSRTGSVIGSSRYYDLKAGESVAIGYTFLARAYWGGQYNKAMKDLMLNHAFQFVDLVVFHVAPENLRSQRAMEKIGGVRRGIVDFVSSGVAKPYIEFGIEKSARSTP